MKVLVIEDSFKHQESARETLKDHEVTLAKTITEAAKILKADSAKEFDAVLTDLFLPIGDYEGTLHDHLVDEADQTEEIPAGLVFAIRAKNLGIPYVGICTDSTRHDHVVCSLLEILGSVWRKPKPGIVHSELRQCHCEDTWKKDWQAVLDRCIAAQKTKK